MTGPDEYESVLGIPPGPRPPNHYQLLGLERFESSPIVIAAAADQRTVDAEESVLGSADGIRQVVSEISVAKACLLSETSKADYDRKLSESILAGQPVPAVESYAVDGGLQVDPQDGPPDERQFEALPADLIDAPPPVSRKKRKFRVYFWTFTLVEAICAVGLLFYLRPAEPVAMPKLAVRGRVADGAPQAGDPPTPRPARRQPQRELSLEQGPLANDPIATTSSNDRSPVLTDPDMAGGTMSPPPPEPAEEAEKGTPPETEKEPPPETGKAPSAENPARANSPWPSEWKLQFPANGDWTVDNEMLSLNADEVKTLAALREEAIFTLRDISTKKPTVVLPFDLQGHLSGVALALLPRNDWRACLSYNNQVLQGRLRIFDAQRNCVCFADYRAKGRAKLLCLCSEGLPVAVQTWRGKESAAYLIELAEGRPIAREQQQLSPEQAKRLAAALAEFNAIETLIRDSERDWKLQLKEWWNKHDVALRLIAALPISDGEMQARKTVYRKRLFDEQHAGLDKLLVLFDPALADPALAAPKPPTP